MPVAGGARSKARRYRESRGWKGRCPRRDTALQSGVLLVRSRALCQGSVVASVKESRREEMGKGGAIRKMAARNASEGREGGRWKRPGHQPGGLKEHDTQSRLEQESRSGMSLFPD